MIDRSLGASVVTWGTTTLLAFAVFWVALACDIIPRLGEALVLVPTTATFIWIAAFLLWKIGALVMARLVKQLPPELRK